MPTALSGSYSLLKLFMGKTSFVPPLPLREATSCFNPETHYYAKPQQFLHDSTCMRETSSKVAAGLGCSITVRSCSCNICSKLPGATGWQMKPHLRVLVMSSEEELPLQILVVVCDTFYEAIPRAKRTCIKASMRWLSSSLKMSAPS